MAQSTPRKKKTTPVKGRVLTPTELDLSEQLQKALTQQVWADAREKVGAPPAPTREELTKGT